jgi:hypothetical protein
MRYAALFLCVGCFCCCTTVHQAADTAYPQLLMQTPLPDFPASVKVPPSEIEIKLLVQEDGSVAHVRFPGQIVDPEWDSLAIESIRRWRFLPARRDNRPVISWVRLQASIKYVQPLSFPLAVIFCETQEEAESRYAALERGEDFEEVGRRISADTSRADYRFLGIMNINSYPVAVRQVLFKLDAGEYTRPIPYGNKFAIFRRVRKGSAPPPL